MGDIVKRKINIKRVFILVLIPILLIGLLALNFTRIRLMIKGYGSDEIKIVLDLDSESIDDILNSESKLSIKKYNKVKNNQNYVLYNLHSQKKNASIKDTVSCGP